MNVQVQNSKFKAQEKHHASSTKHREDRATRWSFGFAAFLELCALSFEAPRLPRRGTAILLTLFATAATSFGQVTNQLSTTPPLPELGFSVLRLLGALALVLALFFAGIWVFKHWQRLALHKGQVPRLNILEVKSLGSRHALYLVAYEQQRLLLASSPAGLSLVTHLPEAGEDEVAVPAPTFVQVLHRALAPKA